MNFELVALHPDSLTQSIAQRLGTPLLEPHYARFSDGEVEITFADSGRIKNKTIILIHGTYPPVHERLVELLLLTHAVKNSGASSVIAVIPYLGYGRHDKTTVPDGLGPLSVIADVLQTAGIDRIITVQAHTPNIQHFFSIPVHNIDVMPLITTHITQHVSRYKDMCLVAPDFGAQRYVIPMAHALNVGYVTCTKQRHQDTVTIVDNTGVCAGLSAILVDDIIDTGATALQVAGQLQKQGVTELYGYFVHPILSGNALAAIHKSIFKQLYVSNSVPLKIDSDTINVFDISESIAVLIQHVVQ